MKLVLSMLVLLGGSVNSFASSVCIMTIGQYVGVPAEVFCDGKRVASFSTDKGYFKVITLQMKKLTDQSYKLETSMSPGQDPSPQYVFVKP